MSSGQKETLPPCRSCSQGAAPCRGGAALGACPEGALRREDEQGDTASGPLPSQWLSYPNMQMTPSKAG